VLEEYNNLIEQYIDLYKKESYTVTLISNHRKTLTPVMEKLKAAAEPYLYDNNINMLLGHISHVIYLLENPTLTAKEADIKSYAAKGYIKQLTAAIAAAAEEKPLRNDEVKLEEVQVTLYNLIVDVLGSNPELKTPAQDLINMLDKQHLKLRYSQSVGEVSIASNLIALGGVARNSAEPVSPSKPKSVTLFSKTKGKRGHDFVNLIGKLDKDFIKEEVNLTQLIEDVKTFKKGSAPRP
jgi:hypothetical protein